MLDAYLSDADRAFRDEVREFVRTHLPADLAARQRREQHLRKEEVASWHHILHGRGWGAPSWPVAYGGTGWNALRQYIFEDACAAADAPPLSPFGLSMVGPVIYTFGSAEQKERFLPPIVAMTEHWCQGYSEPGAGSDLAALATCAELHGDEYVVTGSKIWTSDAHKADWMFCLVRTDRDAQRQKGISFLLIDMRSPGITVRPIVTIDGGHTLNEVFLERVRVPRANLVGEENRGWTYAKFLLGHERIMTADVPRTKRRLQIVCELAQVLDRAGRPLIEDPQFGFRLAGAQIELEALELTNLRLLIGSGQGDCASAASMLKLRGSEVMQLVTELAVEALGPMGMAYELAEDGSRQTPDAPDASWGRMQDYLFRRAATIYAGTSETQRNILSRMAFAS